MRSSPLYYASLACWFLMLWEGVVAANNKRALAIDLVFPRNETYNPSPIFPIIFSYGDPVVIPLFEPLLSYKVWNYSNDSNPIHSRGIDIPLVNDSSINPYIEFSSYTYPFNTEGTWIITLHLRWAYCQVDPDGEGLDGVGTLQRNNTFVGKVIFTTKGPLKQVDLVAATSNQTCSAPVGLAINIKDTVRAPNSDGFEGDTCPIVSPPVEADSCAVTLDPAAVSNIGAAMTSLQCTGPGDDPEGVDCDTWRESRESAGLRIVAGGVTLLAFVLGIVTYIHTLM
jgi:hypothetical protein